MYLLCVCGVKVKLQRADSSIFNYPPNSQIRRFILSTAVVVTNAREAPLLLPTIIILAGNITVNNKLNPSWIIFVHFCPFYGGKH